MNIIQSESNSSANRQPIYEAPEIKKWGTAVSITQTGLTNPGNDGKTGSVPSEGG